MTRIQASILLFLVVLSMTYCAFRVHGFHCSHDPSSVEFWENEYKQIPAETVRVEGDEVTIVLKDKNRQQVYVLHTDKNKPKKGKWYMFGFCRKCHYLFGFNPI